MIKHNITYVDFNGQERKEDFYFHLSLPEVMRLEAEFGTSIDKYAKLLSSQGNDKKMLDFLERLLLTAYGRKTADGKTFYKNDEMRREFEYSQAYANLFEELILTPGLAAKFGEKLADTGSGKKNQIGPKLVENAQPVESPQDTE